MRVGNRLYTSYWHGGFVILNIDDITKPKFVSGLDWSPPFPWPTHTALPVPFPLRGRRVMLVADEDVVRLPGPTSPAFLWLVDITDETRPIPFASFQVAEEDGSPKQDYTGLHQFCEDIRSTEIPIAWFAHGLRVVDIANPHAPKEVASFMPDIPDGAKRVQSNDVCFDDRGLIYLIDRTRGLHILERDMSPGPKTPGDDGVGGVMSVVIRNARVRDQKQLVDIAIEGEKISAVGPKLPAKGQKEIDAAGSLVLPGFLNLHYHADKCLLGEIMRPNISGTLPEAIEITNDHKRNYDPAEVASRAVRTIETGVKNGTTFFRLFCDVGTIGGLKAARGLLLAREKMKDYATIQVVAFPQEGIVRDPGAAELMDEAIKEGCDIVGGLPWYEYTDDDAREHIDICFDLAKKHDLDIHMLVDDTDDANSRSLEYLAIKTMREGFEGRVAASHCGAMAGYNDVYAAKIIDMVATAGVTISVNAHINLVCSARLDREPKRRGSARVKELLARGANVVTSQDDVNDPYYPFGKPDPLECASMMAHVAQLTLPHELEQVMDMVTVNAAKCARLKDYGIAPGMTANLVVVGAPSTHEALRMQPPRRHVFRNGREVARSTLTQELLA